MYLFDVYKYLLWVPESRSLLNEDFLNGVWTAIGDHVRHDASHCARSTRELYNCKSIFNEVVVVRPHHVIGLDEEPVSRDRDGTWLQTRSPPQRISCVS